MQREYVEGVPSGLIACRADGQDVHILGISPRSVFLRAAAPLRQDACVSFCFYQSENGSYVSHTLNHYEPGKAQHENGAVLYRVFFDDPTCANFIRQALNTFARYVETRSTEGASAYGRDTTGYPLEKDAVFPTSPDAARRVWFAQLPPLKPGNDRCLAVELNCRELWELYLSNPVSAFWDAYARVRFIPRSILPDRIPDRLYLGNAYCRLVFPDMKTLSAVLSKAASEKLQVTLVTAEMRSGDESQADELFSLACEQGLEVEINDWGMLQRAQAFGERITLLLGSRLNRRRKDPRMPWKAGFPKFKTLLSENALNSPLYRDFLAEHGVSRYEYESCGLPVCLPEAPCSLHLPFYQTNTSLWCPLRAVCANGDRGAQAPANSCPRWCEQNMLLYPEHLGMLGRWNSLLALNRRLSFTSGFDRWVFNF